MALGNYTIVPQSELSDSAELIQVAVNGVYIQGALLGSNLSYLAECGEEDVELEIIASEHARIFVNDAVYNNAAHTVPLTGSVTKIYISVGSESGTILNHYVLTVTISLSGEKLYFQRWDDVLAINHNPKNNGGVTVTGVRWFKGDEPVGTGRYVEIAGAATDYRAEVEIGGEWHKICHYTGTRSIGIVAYPNPVSRGETLTLQLPEPFVGGRLSIYSTSGTLLKTNIVLPTALSDVNVDDLPSGIYLFKVNSINGNSETVKIIVN